MKKINLCPDTTVVFGDNQYQYKKHFKPLASINLSLINEKSKGQIYIVYCNDDPYCEESKMFQNEFCSSETLVFDIIGNKYRFKADFNYFTTNEDWKQWLLLGDASYNAFIQRKSKEVIDPLGFIKNLNGEPDWIGEDETPVNSKGVKMKFVCQMDSETIIEDFCGKEIYLFYDSTDKIATQIHQFH